MSFSNFLSGLKEKTNELKDEVLKFKNKNFLHAATAGSALIAMADGSIDSAEKQKMLKLIENNDALKVFKTSDVISSFTEFLNNFDFDKDVGESKACEALNRIKDNNVEARTVMRLILAIAASDGVFDQDEKIVAIKIAKELGLNPADFEL
ncbi:MAG: tellurite resistance protein TerB [Moritella dasanensis]|jgi:tellurite resistance protein TerB|uniref:Tellurite resistance TerB family protein n=1 Tax=Moritella marina ATCC 15381 TaxID=1202962 RepID=A0A5J6WMT9_MORMI|nr:MULTISPECIES: tellurite resistance TerB family protein [Moritella]QFI38591.1 tellurite resistance TerB family protein [Moritella marina ATCC 15381]